MNSNTRRLATAADIAADLTIVDYVAGRLDPAERKEFENRLVEDPRLQIRVDAERELSAAIQSSSTGEMPPAQAIEKIRPRLRAGKSRFAMRVAIAASLVAALAIALLLRSPEPEFRTLSVDPVQRVETQSRYRIVFSTSISEAERRAAADLFGFDVVSGPGPGGAFVVETEETVTRQQLLQWRKDHRIDLAEPIHYSSEP